MTEAKARILIVDDEKSIRDSCQQALVKNSYVVDAAEDGYSGLNRIKDFHPDLILIDLKMPGMNGMELLERTLEIDRNIVPVVITGYATIESAVEAMKKGAYDFLPKPFTPATLRIIVKRGLEKKKLVLETEALRRDKKLMEDSFITMVSHQLRSPLAVVLQYFEVILAGLAGDVESKQKDMILRAKDRLGSLMNLICDWLNMAKINGELILEKAKPFSLRHLLKRLVTFIQPLAQEHDITLELTPVSGEFLVQGDEQSIEQVFSNLLSNAVSYNRPKGKVLVTMRTNGEFIAVDVEDNGIGIAKEHLPYIFDQFYRIGKKGDRKIQGTGLGLSIAKKIVEAHGGSIHVESVLTRGSTFTVLLPRPERTIS